MADATTVDSLICHPLIGSVWMRDCTIDGDTIVGSVFDDGKCGSSYMPEDYRGEFVTMNFPVSCIRKQEER